MKGKMWISNKYILVIDDDPDIATLAEQALGIRGYKLSSFTDTLMALDHYKANHKNLSSKAISHTATKWCSRENQYRFSINC